MIGPIHPHPRGTGRTHDGAASAPDVPRQHRFEAALARHAPPRGDADSIAPDVRAPLPVWPLPGPSPRPPGDDARAPAASLALPQPAVMPRAAPPDGPSPALSSTLTPVQSPTAVARQRLSALPVVDSRQPLRLGLDGADRSITALVVSARPEGLQLRVLASPTAPPLLPQRLETLRARFDARGLPIGDLSLAFEEHDDESQA